MILKIDEEMQKFNNIKECEKENGILGKLNTYLCIFNRYSKKSK